MLKKCISQEKLLKAISWMNSPAWFELKINCNQNSHLDSSYFDEWFRDLRRWLSFGLFLLSSPKDRLYRLASVSMSFWNSVVSLWFSWCLQLWLIQYLLSQMTSTSALVILVILSSSTLFLHIFDLVNHCL